MKARLPRTFKGDRYHVCMDQKEPGQDEPLPATLTFVLLMGATFVILWFGLFALLKDRW